MLDNPSATEEQARAILETHADQGIKTGKAWQGDPLWKIEALGIELVAKREGDVDVCVTILPPPTFRHLTALQAEAIVDSIAKVSAQVAELDVERAALPKPKQVPKQKEQGNKKKADTLAERREVQELQAKQIDLKKRHVALLAERDLLCATLRTMRHQLSREENELALREIARLTLRYIRGRKDSEAQAVLAEVVKLNPRLLADDFLGPGVEEPAPQPQIPRIRVGLRLRKESDE